jgi:hypothetical protein
MDYYKSYREELHQVSSMLSDSKVAVYPIEAGGLSTGLPASDITTGSPGVGNKSTAINPSLADDTFGRFNNQLSGDNLAHDTGGLVFRNTNDLNGALQAAIKDSQSYYVLGYYPEKETWDGKHHKIKVTVADKKLKVRTRTGYYAVDPGKQVGLEREPLISSPLRTLSATGVLFYSHVVPPKKAGDQTTVEILADANTLSFVPGPNSTFQPDVDFQVGAFSPDGKTADLKGKHAQGNIPKDIYDQLLQHGMGANIDLTLKPGQYLLRVAIRDNRTGQVGTLDVPLKVNE